MQTRRLHHQLIHPLTYLYPKRKDCKPYLKDRLGVCFLNRTWNLASQKGSIITEGSASRSTFEGEVLYEEDI